MERMIQAYRGILVVIGALLLGGCAMGERQEPKTPVLVYEPASYDIHYPQNAVILSGTEERTLKAFLASTAANPGGNIALMAAPPHTPATAERLGDLRSRLQQWGYASVITVEDSGVPRDRIRVSSSTVTATAPDCPDWSYAHMENYRNSVLSNFGCAHATNLVRMVADPNDLVAGTGDSGADAQRTGGVLEVYRAPPFGIPSTSGSSQTGGL